MIELSAIDQNTSLIYQFTFSSIKQFDSLEVTPQDSFIQKKEDCWTSVLIPNWSYHWKIKERDSLSHSASTPTTPRTVPSQAPLFSPELQHCTLRRPPSPFLCCPKSSNADSSCTARFPFGRGRAKSGPPRKTTPSDYNAQWALGYRAGFAKCHSVPSSLWGTTRLSSLDIPKVSHDSSSIPGLLINADPLWFL